MAKKGLGKGLGALITSSTAAEQPRHEMIPVDSISPNPMQPRRRFNEESLEELAESLKEHGLVQPIIVRPSGTGYEILVGERRWRAAQIAGATSIPAVIREAEASECLQIALVENLHRDDLNGIEEATAFRQLVEDFGLSQDDISQKVGKSRSAVANALRLLQLPVEVQAAIVAEEITPGHARALLALQGDPYQALLLQRIIEEDLSVRQTEEVARRRLGGGEEPAPREKPQFLGEYADLISAGLQVKVRVIQGKRKGKIIIEFKGEKELQRLMSEMGIAATDAG
ncbi:MAG: ParB/RepB/Spo0J family partition protein [Actinobacteria bacterium]|jgi:ParB family chromosome partitioning protein|nr:MAG: ParB/RepB/Spo0J family partition protein [Actinomycetota bacterium]